LAAAAGVAVEPSARTGERTDRTGAVVLWVAALYLALNAALEAYRFTLPTDGWSLAPPVEAPVFGEDLLGLESGIRPGDVLVAVDGVPFPVLLFEAMGLRQADLAYAAGDAVSYTVARGGELVDVEVSLGRWTAAGIARAVWRTLVGTPLGGVYRWLAWLLAAYVFARRPGLRARSSSSSSRA